MIKKSCESEWNRYLQLMKERPELFIDNGPLHIVFDEQVIKNFEQETGRTIGVVYESPYSIKVVDLVYEVPGEYFAYERTVSAVKKGAVVIVPVYKDKFILLKQYRHCIRDYEYSFPRGFGEADLSAEENAKKELGEEIGAEVKCVSFLGEMTPDSGGQSTVVSLYSCEISSYNSNIREEGIEGILELTWDELQQYATDGKIKDGFTLSALFLYERKYRG